MSRQCLAHPVCGKRFDLNRADCLPPNKHRSTDRGILGILEASDKGLLTAQDRVRRWPADFNKNGYLHADRPNLELPANCGGFIPVAMSTHLLEGDFRMQTRRFTSACPDGPHVGVSLAPQRLHNHELTPELLDFHRAGESRYCCRVRPCCQRRI